MSETPQERIARTTSFSVDEVARTVAMFERRGHTTEDAIATTEKLAHVASQFGSGTNPALPGLYDSCVLMLRMAEYQMRQPSALRMVMDATDDALGIVRGPEGRWFDPLI